LIERSRINLVKESPIGDPNTTTRLTDQIREEELKKRLALKEEINGMRQQPQEQTNFTEGLWEMFQEDLNKKFEEKQKQSD